MATINQTATRQALMSANGGTIKLVPYPNFPNLAIPDLSVPDASQLYDVGTEYEYNGKAYFYAKASGTVAPDMPVKTKNVQDITQVAATVAAWVYFGFRRCFSAGCSVLLPANS